MKKVFKTIFAAVLAASMLPVPAMVNAAQTADVVVKLNPVHASPFNNGKFEGWGTSMGWWGNRIGHSDKMAEQAAKLFYSDEGLGLDIVRYNVGGGDDPTHNHITRSDSKLPCFAVPELDADGKPVKGDDGEYVYTYDWNADADQMNVLKRIKEHNDDVHIEGYTNSPPWFMTNSGCSGGGVDAGENLDPANYAQFAKFLADVTEHFDEIGLTFDSYSPMNEPNPVTKYWGALSPKQEGNLVAPGANQSGVIDALSAVYDERGIDTLVVGLDETSIDYSITSFNALTETAKSNLDRLDTHTYGGSKRAQLKQTAIDGGKNLWMSEVDGSWDEFGLADRIIADLNGMQASAWVLWDIVDFHKDSNFTDPSGNKTEAKNSINPDAKMWGMAMGNHDTEEIELSQKYYGYGQFTRYIQPGMTLIESSGSTLAAYDQATGEIVIVAVNSGNKAKTVKFDLRDFTRTGSQAIPIRTSGSYATGEHWAQLEPIEVTNKQFTAELKADSITTFVIGEDAAVEKFEATDTGLSYKYTTSGVMQGYDKRFAVYNADGTLNTVIDNKSEGTLTGDFTGCTFKLMVWDDMKPVIDAVTTVTNEKPVGYVQINGSSTIVEGVDYDYIVVSDLAFVEGSITWSVSDDEAAEVTQNKVSNSCTVKAKKSGTFTLRASYGDGKYTEMDINALGADQWITITNKKSGLGLETKSKSINSGTQLVQWENRDLDTAAWKLIATEDGHYNIINGNADMLLASNSDQKPVISADIEASDDNAKWDLINHGGYYEIKNVAVEKSLNVSGQSTANGGSVILYAFGSGDNELWSLNAASENLEHVIIEPVDYSKKYANSNYNFVSNIEALTNDFNDSALKGFVVTGDSKLASDDAGESVLAIQSALRSTSGGTANGTATLELNPEVTCEDGQIINTAFDIFLPNSLGESGFTLASGENELVKLVLTNWGSDYTFKVGAADYPETGIARNYFCNNQEKSGNFKISNGAHIEIYYTPSTGAVTVTMKSNANSSALKTYTGTVAENLAITKLLCEAAYTQYARPAYMDNLVTNIITEK